MKSLNAVAHRLNDPAMRGGIVGRPLPFCQHCQHESFRPISTTKVGRVLQSQQQPRREANSHTQAGDRLVVGENSREVEREAALQANFAKVE